MAAGDGLCIAEIVLAFMEHAKRKYVKHGQPTGEVEWLESTLRIVRESSENQTEHSQHDGDDHSGQSVPGAETCRSRSRSHPPSNRARVRLGGRDVWLGLWGSSEAEDRYRRVVAEWLTRSVMPINRDAVSSPTIDELILAYWRHAELYYQ